MHGGWQLTLGDVSAHADGMNWEGKDYIYPILDHTNKPTSAAIWFFYFVRQRRGIVPSNVRRPLTASLLVFLLWACSGGTRVVPTSQKVEDPIKYI